MRIGPVKIRAGKRILPLPKLAGYVLDAQAGTQARYRTEMGSAWPDTDLAFTTRMDARSTAESHLLVWRVFDGNGIRSSIGRPDHRLARKRPESPAARLIVAIGAIC